MISPAVTAVVIAILAALAFGGGFALSDWRTASQIQRLNTDNAMLSAANDKCATDIQSVRMALEALTVAAAKREKDAVKAMRAAATAAATHTGNAKKIRSLRPVPLERGKHCEMIAAEQIQYVQNRRGNNAGVSE
ncbi:hypothetical protein [Nitrosospira sp. NpAV]|uniref:hypothetical protein n=1 Tax=Nitrosospira sp. NpAV TaxID=58133 RepID=UPI0005A28BEA|nr:hypothetical protein [Nitrosospira sp. NpAV]KIO48206.1 hypothetical protein SQ11_13710 [Nitrosospira sp. NpAV]